MKNPRVSVVIPAYCGRPLLKDAVGSVLEQTFEDLEVIVVDDKSPDSTTDLVRSFQDPRVRLIRHDVNQGAVAARRTGVAAAQGEIVAFLDQDDRFHPEKLAAHVDLLDRNPGAGASYNSRFDVEADNDAVRSIWQPPSPLGLSDLILAFPVAPSDVVVRRKWAQRPEIWDQSHVRQDGEAIVNGAEYTMLGRLVLAGCTFAGVGRPLNYRRYHARRKYVGLASRCEAEIQCQEIVFSDPRCPASIRQLRNQAFATTYKTFAYYAFAQGETTLGQSFVRLAVENDPSLVGGERSELISYLCRMATDDDGHGGAFDNRAAYVCNQLPPELSTLTSQTELAAGRIALLKGLYALLFEAPDAVAHAWFEQIPDCEGLVDDDLIGETAHQLLGYCSAFGADKTQQALLRIAPLLESRRAGGARLLKSRFWINQMFRHYRRREYASVPQAAVRALVNRPSYLANRGVASVVVKSSIDRLRTAMSS